MARPRAKVLVVDDDPATRDGLTALLETWGYSASSTADGKTALKLCAKELPQAVVTDLMMPGMNGIEFIEGLREQVQQVAVVMMTGLCGEAQMQLAATLGANSYTLKPANAEQFLRTVLASTNYWLTIHQYPDHHLPPESCKR